LAPLLNAAKSLKLGEGDFKPNFFNFSVKEYLEKILDSFFENRAKTTISIGIMVKNQEEKISDTIKGALVFCDHLIVVDTGSTDGTVDRIRAVESDKIEFHEITWTGDFSEMRNNIIELNKNRWLFFIDSDERIYEKESFQALRNTLTLIDILSKNTPVSLQIKQWAAQYASFSYIDRIIRKGDETRFHGIVHEGICSEKKGLNYIHFDFQVYNSGLEPSEVEKFNKRETYKKLTLQLLEKEPDNPRWIANMTNPDERTSPAELEDYLQLLKRGLLIDTKKKVSLSNLRDSEYLHMIFGKYLLAKLLKNELNSTITEAHTALKRFPQSTFILFIYHYAKYLKNQGEKELLFDELLSDLSAVDAKEAEEVSQQRQDLIKSLVIKYMFDFHNYQAASLLLEDISDEAAKKNLLLENEVLKRIRS
jgi:glycosyltransferase involved in cell wall biosynthesis